MIVHINTEVHDYRACDTLEKETSNFRDIDLVILNELKIETNFKSCTPDKRSVNTRRISDARKVENPNKV